MSRRELTALLKDHRGPTTSGTRRGTVLPGDRDTLSTLEEAGDELDDSTQVGEVLPTTSDSPAATVTMSVQDLQLEVTETAVRTSDGELRRVSGECERVSGEARVVHDLASSFKDLTGTGPASLTSFFQSFLDSQTKLLTAQANALAVQSAPPLAVFTGEDVEDEEKSFDRWLARFEERASLLAWSDEQKCYQVKVHLTRTALQVYELLSTEDRSSYSKLITAPKARFKPVDIEELRGLEFHQLMQTDEYVVYGS